MVHFFTPKVVAASHSREGKVIYQSVSGWTQHLSEAEVLTDEAHADLRLIEASQQRDIAVGPYLADLTTQTGAPARAVP